MSKEENLKALSDRELAERIRGLSEIMSGINITFARHLLEHFRREGHYFNIDEKPYSC